ncbi:hybrid sensor histidine kinase/response regulator [Hahella sp. CCB-MM4]|uniref:ATP-binding response regulator n=1 Tax=Hahella sp. (strain CCB-MM4) TaxID=1926491 RepID=UPI000B9B282D|nr:ATP-binding protein [Hahella sp. CCB-MM4]OZG74634.1 hybrid sensor histidine kinase/response regulator [Hahella sp. CCB-MM4]
MLVKRIRWIVGIALVTATVILAVAIFSTIGSLREGALEVRVAKDDLYWSIHQIESEAMNLLIIAHTMQNGEHPPEDLNTRYSVLLSRTDLFKEGEFREAVNILPDTRDLMMTITTRVEALGPLIESALKTPDAIPPALIEKLEIIRRTARDLTLTAHKEHVTHRVIKRGELTDTFYYTEALLCVLAGVIVISMVSLYWLMYLARKAQLDADFQRRRAESNSDAKSRFLSNMSHELRTPLNAIMGFAQLIQLNSRNLTTEQTQYINQIYKASEHLLSLIIDIMDLSKIESGQLSIELAPCQIQPVINESVAMVRSMAQANSISIYKPDLRQDYLINANHTRTVQVLTNFLTNAIKYNHKGGWVKIELDHNAITGMLRISVADNGMGIAKKDHCKVFKPFERLAHDPAIEGSGIGLAMSSQLVQLMNGQIGFNSKEDQGSYFWLELPVLEVVTAPSEETATTGSENKQFPAHSLPEFEYLEGLKELASGLKTVLYIEDNDSSIRVMEGLFDSFANIRLMTATTAEQGLDLARSCLPQLILLDLNLPTTSGLEVCALLRNDPRLSDIPIIAVTANVNGSQEAREQGLEFDEFILKPIDIASTKSIILQYLGQYQPSRKDLSVQD